MAHSGPPTLPGLSPLPLLLATSQKDFCLPDLLPVTQGPLLGCQAVEASKVLTRAWGSWPSSWLCLPRQRGWSLALRVLGPYLPGGPKGAWPPGAVLLAAARGDRAQEAWSAVAWGLGNVLAPAWLPPLKNQGNLTQPPSVCFCRVWGSLVLGPAREKQPVPWFSPAVPGLLPV